MLICCHGAKHSHSSQPGNTRITHAWLGIFVPEEAWAGIHQQGVKRAGGIVVDATGRTILRSQWLTGSGSFPMSKIPFLLMAYFVVSGLSSSGELPANGLTPLPPRHHLQVPGVGVNADGPFLHRPPSIAICSILNGICSCGILCLLGTSARHRLWGQITWGALKVRLTFLCNVLSGFHDGSCV